MMDMGVNGRSKAQRWLMRGAVALVVGACAYWAYGLWRGDVGGQDVALKCWNENCTYSRSSPLQLGEMLPMTCPLCDQASVLPAYPCASCGTRVVLNEARGINEPTLCPSCGQEVRHGR